MDDSKRLHRGDPVRIDPVRNFSGLYHLSGSDGGGRFTSTTPPSSNGIPAGGRESPRDEGVGLAYRVIETYMNEGRKNAGQFNNQPYNMRAVTDGFQELLERTIRIGSELLPLWLEVLGSAVRLDPAAMPYTAGTAPHQPASAAQTMASKAISIEMISNRPVQVSLDLREGSESLPLVTPGLHAVDPGKAALTDISFAPEPGGASLKLKISIPDTHPPGTYSGVVVNRDTGETHGTLSVRIAQ
jgi:hypothetical protein